MFTLDFEASGLHLGLSYPIEVGYTDGTLEREMLIRSSPDWWYWDDTSELVHGISRNELALGMSVFEVCETMNQDLKDQTVVVDGGQYDLYWLNTLYDAAGFTPTFQLAQITDNEWFRLRSEGDIAHRALADARQLWEFIHRND